MTIIQLDQYFQFLAEGDLAFNYYEIPWISAQLDSVYGRLVKGESLQLSKLDLSNIRLHDVTVDVPEIDLENNLTLFIDEKNTFENRGYISNEIYYTSIVSEAVTNLVKTTNTTGYKFGEKLTVSSKFKAKVPIVDVEGEYSVGFELSFEQNISSAVEEFDGRTITITVPSQPVAVRPRTRKLVSVQLFRLDSPSIITSTSGYATGSIPVASGRNNLYDALSRINTTCPQKYVNRDDHLRLDSNRKALCFQGAGTATVSAVSLDFRIVTREEDLDTGDIISVNNKVKRASIQV
ncbi:ETX/MTX2 family pore-forming toxin [Bacillus cereus group sp. BfR-BA-01354]|uniref:ETX/MTX2 family pore-forming toxin n=1 Tax=Bacillus cereus group TaxID=86661 RepID=UPI001F57FAD2